jgi:hypothetical protein
VSDLTFLILSVDIGLQRRRGACQVVACLSRVYFDHFNSTTILEASTARYSWFYAHLPLVIGITAVGVALKKAVLIDPGHALRVRSAGCCLVPWLFADWCWSFWSR